MNRTQRQYPTLTAAPTRGLLPPMVGVIIPIARTNILTNPSIELATTGYTAVGGSIARSAADQYHGTYSLAVTPSAGTNSDGAFYGTVSLTTGTPYAYSVKFRATGAGIGKQYALSVATTGGVDLHATTFTATGRWQWIRGVYGETSTASRRIYIRKINHAAASVFYADGWQVESCADGVLEATTYIDGDQQGLLVGQQPPAYGWNGTPHASTSYRTALTRAGGYVVNLSVYNFLLTALLSLGMAVPNNVSVPYTVLDGARFQRVTKPPRTISLTGRFQADDLPSLMAAQSDMRQAFDRDLVPLQQPMVLQVEPQDNCGQAIGDFANIQCLYAGGLEGNDGNVPVEDVAPTFTMYVPFLIGGDAGASLSVQQSVSNANLIIQRSPAGVWSALSTGMTGGLQIIRTLIYGLDGTLYAGGDFTDAGGSGADNFAQWNGSAWAVVGSATAISGIVLSSARGPDGRIYIGGAFLNAGGDANADRIAVWNGAAWAGLSTGANGLVYALVFDAVGNLYAGGDFTSIGGVAANRIAKWDGSAWTALGTGANSIVRGLTIGKNGTTLYAAGLFTTLGGTTVNGVGVWNGSAWASMAGGVSGAVEAYSLATGQDGRIYIGGDFTAVGGVSAANIAAWNGTGWTPLGSGTGGAVLTVFMTPDKTLYAAGGFTVAGGITLPDRTARWNGSTWLPSDADLPGSGQINAVAVRNDGNIVFGYSTISSAITAAVTTVTNDTPGYVYPRLVINGPSSGTSRIYQIINYTTGFGVWLNLTLSPGEVATFNFDPQALSFTTTFQGDVTGMILPGSQLALMYLAPGSNAISFFAASSTVVATLSWQKRYNGTADLVN
jgi:hypothetical protein